MESINNNSNKVWIVTGTSSGLGLSLVKKLLVEGYSIAALTRKPEEITNQMIGLNITNLLIIKTDITNDSNVKDAVELTIKRFGHIDTVVNMAGYGLVGSIEEISDLEIRKIYDVNVFGTLNVTRHTTKYLRQQNYGTIINVSSVMGWDNMGLYGAYSSTKHAVNAITYSLQKELEPFNIKVILTSPGGFRTNFVVGETSNFQIPKQTIQQYKTDQLVELFNKHSPNSNGDPEKAASILIQLTTMDQPPLNLFMGSDSLNQSKAALESHLKENEKYSELSKFTDFNNTNI